MAGLQSVLCWPACLFLCVAPCPRWCSSSQPSEPFGLSPRDSYELRERKSSPGSTPRASASLSRVETLGSRLPRSMRLTSPGWTPLRSETCSCVSPSCSRASRRLVPRLPTAGIVQRRRPRHHVKLYICEGILRCSPEAARAALVEADPDPIGDRDRPPSSHCLLGVLVNHVAQKDMRRPLDLHRPSPPPIRWPRHGAPGGGGEC